MRFNTIISSSTLDKKAARAFRLVKDDINRIFMVLDGIKKELSHLKGSDIEVVDQLIGLNQSLQNVKHSTDEALKDAEIANEEAKEALEEAEDLNKYKPKVVQKIVYKKASKSTSFVAAKGGKKFHRPSCPFAKNILPKKKLVFKTRDAALNNGYKECKCLLR